MRKIFIFTFFSLVIISACAQDSDQQSNQSQSNNEANTAIVPPPQPGDYPEIIDQQSELTDQQPEIFVDFPMPGTTVSSPIMLSGKALGPWFFEGVLPVSLEDSAGNLLSAAPARALDDWQQEGYIKFEAQLDFETGTIQNAFIIIKNDNPSGLPENSKSFKVPVKLSPMTP